MTTYGSTGGRSGYISLIFIEATYFIDIVTFMWI